jgi:hypothetical protein
MDGASQTREQVDPMGDPRGNRCTLECAAAQVSVERLPGPVVLALAWRQYHMKSW